MKILITGANGQLGQELQVISKLYSDWQFYFLGSSELDITNQEQVNNVYDKLRPSLCINCAAYTAVDRAESEPELCHAVNVIGSANIAQACASHATKAIHISSDYVYHSTIGEPIKETDPTTPVGIYAKTKLLGEAEIIKHAPSYLIIRTSWVYSSFGSNFLKTMIRLGSQHDALTIVSDQIGTPSNARDIARMLCAICDQGWEPTQNGIYNFSNEGITNWADFARRIFDLKGIDCTVRKTTTEAYGAAAERPLWSVLSKEKIKSSFGIKIRDWEESLKECLELL